MRSPGTRPRATTNGDEHELLGFSLPRSLRQPRLPTQLAAASAGDAATPTRNAANAAAPAGDAASAATCCAAGAASTSAAQFAADDASAVAARNAARAAARFKRSARWLFAR